MNTAVPGPPQRSADLVLRPSMLRYLQAYRATTAMLVVIAVVLFLRGGGVGTLFALLLAAGGSGLMSLYFRRASVVVTPTELVATGLLRRRRTPRGSVTTAVSATMPRSHPRSPTFPHLFVLDGDGRRVARLSGTHWLEDDHRRLLRALGLTPQVLRGVSTGKELARTHPRAVSLLERRPLLKTLLIAVPGVAVAVALVLTSTD
ncbi:hypothetical protein CLV30_107175 [Haloactinopolyspora alba]|uniref:PH (Pleckstrin Homology) domain-containing protein n=1 Tax=Haloactinopolyspora alba TaxID=648780 RepID=A0A2P8E2I5_9ACTN|nr:hypothetical protein [Haloactinopolyspora alba]PSL03694.1 hypothetical protein CLV30_107175 [Haloactinopolyspora alba]